MTATSFTKKRWLYALLAIAVTCLPVVYLAFSIWRAESKLSDFVRDANRSSRSVAAGDSRTVAPLHGDVTQPAIALGTNVENSTPSASSLYAQLPPVGLPLRFSIEALRKASNDGNFIASCRLADELSNCKLLKTERTKVAELVDEMNALGNDSERFEQASRTLFASRAGLKELEQSCQGIEAADIDASWRYLLLAALQGHRPSMVQFATLPTWDVAHVQSNVDAWVAWKKYSGEFLENAATHGDRSAVYQLSEDYADDSIFGPGGLLGIRRVPVNFERALMYSYASEALRAAHGIAKAPKWVTERVHKLESSLSQEAIARARVQADALAGSWDSSVMKPKFRNASPEPRTIYDLPCVQ